MDIDVLKAEIDNDPITRGYAAMDDAQVVDSLNDTIDRVVSRATLTGSELLSATDEGEYDALTDAQKDRWLALAAVDSVETNSGVAKKLVQVFTGGVTVSNLIALRDSTVSRGIELGLGVVKEGNVQEART